MKDQQHYAGSRGRGSTEDRIINEGIMGMVWCARTDSHNDRMAPVAWQFHGNGKYRSGTKNIYIEDGHSMIPIFV